MWDSFDCVPFVLDELREVYGLDGNTYGPPQDVKNTSCAGPDVASEDLIPAWPVPLHSDDLAEMFPMVDCEKTGGLSHIRKDTEMMKNGVSFIYGSASLTADLPPPHVMPSWKEARTAGNGEQEATPCCMASQDTASLDALQVGYLLQSGSFGQVHEGTWFGAEVAVKVIWSQDECDYQDCFEFNEELKISTMMHHPNVVRTYDWIALETLERKTTKKLNPGSLLNLQSPISKKSKKRGLNVIVMEKSSMGTLSDFFEDSKDTWLSRFKYGVDTDVAMETLKDIARGLMYMHQQRVVHADVKPCNILLFPSCNQRGFAAKLSDFGLSRILPESSDAVETSLTGNLLHSAPEYMRDGVLSTAADVYGFGVLMWEVFTGKSPYHDHSNVMFAVWNKEPLEFPANCPAEYRLLSERCTSMDASDRPTMAMVLDCLNDMDVS